MIAAKSREEEKESRILKSVRLAVCSLRGLQIILFIPSRRDRDSGRLLDGKQRAPDEVAANHPPTAARTTVLIFLKSIQIRAEIGSWK